MHTYIDGGTQQQPAVTGEGALKGATHLQGHEANAAFSASNNMMLPIDAPIQFQVENASRGYMAQIKATATDSTEQGDN